MSINCIAFCNHLIYIVPVCHLKTGIQEPINVIICLHRKIIQLLRKKKVISSNYQIIGLIIIHGNLL